MPFAIVACLALLLGVLALVFDGGDEEAAAPALRPDSIARIVERVERERGLKFEHVPEPVEVTPARARREGLARSTRTTRRHGAAPTPTCSSCSG